MEIEIEHLKTNVNIVIMKLKDYKNLKEATNSYYKLWREKEKRIDKAIKYIETGQEKTLNSLINGNSKVEMISYQKIIDILKGDDKE